MATLGTNLLSWTDIKGMFGDDGALLSVANVLEEAASIVSDGPWFPSNKPLGHVTAQQTALPSVGRYRFNRGTTSSKGSQTNVEDSITMISGMSTVDMKLLEIYGGEVAARRRQGRGFAEAMKQQFVDDIIYGTLADDPEGIEGMMARLNAIGSQVLDAGGTGSDLSSVLLIGWGEGKTYFTHPKNAPGGLRHRDLGEQLIQSDDDLGGAKALMLVDNWSWDYGLVFEDPRYQARIANLESADVLSGMGTQEIADYFTNIVTLMSRLIEHIYDIEMCRPVFYMSRKMREGLRTQFTARTQQNAFRYEDMQGKRVFSYDGIPIRTLDGMTNLESQVT